QGELDLARSIQEITEEVMLKMSSFVHRETGMKRLCMAGGVALNCVGNGRILREGPFEEIWIQPAAGDAGGAVGIALALWHRYLDKPRVSPEATGAWQRPSSTPTSTLSPGPPRYADGMNGSYLGPRSTNDEVKAFLDANGYKA